MVVFDPVKVVITNYAKDHELLETDNNPEDPKAGVRQIPFSKEIYIEREDFMETAKKIFSPGAGTNGEIEKCLHY